MAHDLATNRNGEAMIALLRQPAWHKLGTVLSEAVSGDEMLKRAGMDWEVFSAPLFANGQKETGLTKATGWDNATDKPLLTKEYAECVIQVPNRKAIYRSDTGVCLGIAGEGYEIFQNQEMIQVMDTIAKDSSMEYEVAGALGAGERVWILASIKDLNFDIKGDQVKQYLTIKSSHNGSSALDIHPTTIRVVCANTWRASEYEIKRVRAASGKNTFKGGFTIKHTKNMKDMVSKAIAIYQQAVETNAFSRKFHESLAEVKVTGKQKDDFFSFVANGGEDIDTKTLEDGALSRYNTRLDTLNGLWNSPTNQTEATKGTAYGLLQTAGEYVDHFAGTRCTNGRSEDASRFESSQFGTGADLKDLCVERVAELAGV